MTTIVGVYSSNGTIDIVADTKLTCANTRVTLGKINKIIDCGEFALAISGNAGIITAYRYIADQFEFEVPRSEQDVFYIANTLYQTAVHDYHIMSGTDSGMVNMHCQMLIRSTHGLWSVFNTMDIVEQEVCAIGSGAAYALGAMAAGSDSNEAIKIASRYDNSTGGDVTKWCRPL